MLNDEEKEKRMLELQLRLNAARAANNLAASNEISRSHGLTNSNSILKKNPKQDSFYTPMSQLRTNDSKGPSCDDHLNEKDVQTYIKDIKKIPISLYSKYSQYQITLQSEDGKTRVIKHNTKDYVDDKQIDNIKNSLIKNIEKNKNRNERAQNYDVSGRTSVDFINDKNRRFNRKLARAYDKYTEETRLNLERGGTV